MHEFSEFGQDQIQNLRGAHIERALLEKECEWVGFLVTRDLQDSFIDRKHHGTRRLRGSEFYFQHLAGLHFRWRVEGQFVGALVQIHRERHGAVRQRAHEYFIRAGIANVLHRYVTIALEALRQTDFLYRCLRAGFEPLVRINFVALDGDKTCTGIWRANADFDFLASAHIFAFQRQLQFGIAIQRACDVTGTGHRILDAVLFHAITIADAIKIRPRCISRQRQTKASRRDGDGAVLDRDFFGP